MQTLLGDEWFEDLLADFTAYYLTSVPVFLAVFFGTEFPRPGENRSAIHPDLVSACIHYDAAHYVQITREGYAGVPHEKWTRG